MAYAQCKGECKKVLRRSGGLGFKLSDYCCPHCGGNLKNSPMPEFCTDGKAISRWDYKNQDPEYIASFRRKEMTWLGVVGYPNRTKTMPLPHLQHIVNEAFYYCL